MKLDTRSLTLITVVLVALLIVGYIVYQSQANSSANEPSGPVDFRLDEQPTLGDAEAPVTIVALEDFKCPVCRRFEQTVVPRIEQELIETGRANMAFVNYQFLGPDSITAGIAGECAYRQDEDLFWEYKTIIFRAQGDERQTWATPERLLGLAREYVPDLDAEELEQCIEERRYEDEVLRDRDAAVAAGATGTPTIFVDGERLPDWQFDTIEDAVERAQASGQ